MSAATNAEERVHHPTSPSSLQSREACATFQGDNSGPVHVRATAGTRAHGVTDTRIDDNRLSDEDAVAAAECIDYYYTRLAALSTAYQERVAARIIKNESPPLALAPMIELNEVYLPIDDIQFDDAVGTTAGYIDRAIIAPDFFEAEMMDWKFGMWPVEKSSNNLQGIAYALGLFKAYPLLPKITFTFKQPHLEYVTSAVFTRDMIPDLYLRIKVVVARSREAQKRAAVGDWSMATPYTPVCLFCKHLASCGKVAEAMLKVARKFSPLDVPDNITPSLLRDPKHTSTLKGLASVAATWAKAVNAQIIDQVLRGSVPIPDGFKIQSRADREIVDQNLFKLTALGYLTAEEFNATLSPSISKVEAIISSNAPRMQKTATVNEFKDKLLAAGAVVKGDPYSFLKAIAKKGDAENSE